VTAVKDYIAAKQERECMLQDAAMPGTNFRNTSVLNRTLKEGKERKWTYIAPIVSTSTTKRSDVDHTELPANTPHLPLSAVKT